MEVTASGLPRQRRNELQAVVQRLRGAWSGALTVGRCDAVVVAGAGAVDWQAPKLVVARLHGIPVVASEWLEDSLQRGFLLATAPYELLPPAPARRSSAASTSLATGCPAALTSAAAAAAAVLMAPPEVLQNTQQQQQQQQRAVAPGSPEVELMRDAPQPQSPLAPLFLERSPAAASPLPSASKQLPAAPVVLQDPLLLPASVSAQHRSSLQLDSPWPSPGACHNPLPAQLSPDEVDHGSPADLLPSPLSTASQQNGSTGPLAGGLPGSSSRVGRAAGTPHSMQGEAVTPVGAAAMGGSRSPASTDSDTVVARFMSRFSCITVARGGATTCPSLSSPTANSVGTSICSSLGSSVGGMAESPVIYSPCSMCGSSPALQTREEQEGAAGAPAAPAQEPEGSKGGAIAAGLQPSPSSAQRHWHAQSVMRMRRSLREGLPTTTLVRLGPLLQRPPTRSTLEGLAERHSDGDADGELAPPPATFHASAAARPAGGSELQFVAGDTSHGALMLYDLAEGGRPVYALALIQSIYRLEDEGEAWMEHRYLLTGQDLAERPAWAAALQGHNIGEGEVLLSAGSYHSPMHLISGEFWLSFPGRAQRLWRGQGQPAADNSANGGSQRQPAWVCRRGFDTAAGTVVPLRRALEGFTV